MIQIAQILPPSRNCSSVKNKIAPTFKFERRAKEKGYSSIAGVDEVGRGPVAGPVVAAAVSLTFHRAPVKGVRDSKLLPEKKREELYQRLTESAQIVWHYAVVSVEEIESYNIYHASRRAMEFALTGLSQKPQWVLVDGRPFRSFAFPHEGIIQGDRLSYSIAAASIIAKVVRDRLMKKYHEQWPHYGFDQHKGYGTPQHLEALKQHGPCPIHRSTFAPVAELA